MATSVYTSLLLKDYKRKAGEIKALRKDLRETVKVVLVKERELAALGTILKAREPDLNLQSVRPVATYPKVMQLKWGLLTRMILTCLREANGTPVSGELVADYVIASGHLEVQDRAALISTRLSVRKRLKGLAAAGKIVGHHVKSSNTGSSWSLPSHE